MKLFQCIVGAVLALHGLAQSPPKGPERIQNPDWLETRWRTRIARDLAKKGVARTASSPKVADFEPLLAGLKGILPEGKLIMRTPSSSARPIRGIDLQVQTTVDETTNTRFIQALNVWIERQEDPEAVQERLVRHLRTPAIYELGPLKGVEPGQLCYHVSGWNSASEIYIRENVLVAIHCLGPTDVRKVPLKRGEDPRYAMGERTTVASQCAEVVPDVAVRIDHLILEQLVK